jgi:MoxR-like ATPase
VNLEELSQRSRRVETEIARVVLGQEETVHNLLVSLLAGGHVLMEGVPGLGKTLLARTLSHVLGATFKRLQFTPDLMPSDVTGSHVYSQREERFVFVPGPIFTQLLLADEINRAPAKTQAALLEAMQDRSVTTDGQARALPSPFFVIATQNPVESQGTYPLPEAQLDRFLLMIAVGHPSREAERQVVTQSLAGFNPSDLGAVGLTRVLSADELLAMQAALSQVTVAPELVDYAVDIVTRTRTHRSVYLGASPRGSLGLVACARAHAATEGRPYVIPDDVKAFAVPVLRHRLVLQPDAELEGVSAEDVVTAILGEAPVPKAVG